MSTDQILIDSNDAVLSITFNRPEKRNALNVDMYLRIIAALDEAQQDDQTRVVLLRGQEDCFTAGNDLKDFDHRNPGEKSAGIRLLETLARFEKPLVAAVAGFAVGIGTTMLLHCDLVYAAANTRFRLPFIPLGLVPEGASSLLIPRQIGHTQAAKLLLLGDFFDSATALRAGIICEEIPIDSLFDHARAVAHQLASLPARALLETKRLMKRPGQQQVLETISEESRVIQTLLNTAASRAARGTATGSEQ
jgi:enoyl-CoA hydratase/carnithine racemase